MEERQHEDITKSTQQTKLRNEVKYIDYAEEPVRIEEKQGQGQEDTSPKEQQLNMKFSEAQKASDTNHEPRNDDLKFTSSEAKNLIQCDGESSKQSYLDRLNQQFNFNSNQQPQPNYMPMSQKPQNYEGFH